MTAKSIIAIAFCAAAAIVAAVAIKEPQHTDAQTQQTDLPQTSSVESLKVVKVPAGTMATDLRYEGFDVLFSPKHKQPYYVAWILTPEHTDGPYKRDDADFAPDPNVEGCPSLNDYRGSGYDRGHMAPAGDMKWSKKAMEQCHYLTNMTPQDSKLNSGAWATVEKNARRWAQKYGRLVIIAGPVLSDRLTQTIGEGKIPVPQRFFKVILAPDANPPQAIAFVMPNHKVEGGAQATVTTVDQVEQITGYDFFSSLPDDVENSVESSSNFAKWR